MRPSEKVVGSKMPQYRLFGDTVDVAGMMTITGEGQRRIEINCLKLIANMS